MVTQISFYRQWKGTVSSDGITRKLSTPPAYFTFHFLFLLLVRNHSTSVRLDLKMTKEALTKCQGLEKEMAIHSSILAWRIPWTEEPGGLLFMGSQRVRHDWVTKHCTKAKVKWVCENVLFFLIEFCGWAFIVLWHSLGIWIWLLCENFLIRWEVWVTRCWNILP